MATNNSTGKNDMEALALVNERIRESVRKSLEPRTISIDVSTEFLKLCAQYKTTPETLLSGFITNASAIDDSGPYNPYAAFFHQAAYGYIEAAHGSTRIILGGKYTERPTQITIN